MPADTPTLEEILLILGRATVTASFLGLDSNSITINLSFKRDQLGPAAKWVFERPTHLFDEIRRRLAEDDILEEKWRSRSPINTIEECISYIQNEIRFISKNAESKVHEAMMRKLLGSTLVYLQEIQARRSEADRRKNQQEQARKTAEEDEIRAKVAEERRHRDRQRTSDSGRSGTYGSGPPPGMGPWDFDGRANAFGYNEAFWREAFKQAGIDPGAFEGIYTGKKPPPPPPPPPPGTKRKWYEILNCKAGASRDEIRRAAREAAKGLHPDKNSNPADAERFKEISEAKAEGLAGCPA